MTKKRKIIITSLLVGAIAVGLGSTIVVFSNNKEVTSINGNTETAKKIEINTSSIPKEDDQNKKDKPNTTNTNNDSNLNKETKNEISSDNQTNEQIVNNKQEQKTNELKQEKELSENNSNNDNDIDKSKKDWQVESDNLNAASNNEKTNELNNQQKEDEKSTEEKIDLVKQAIAKKMDYQAEIDKLLDKSILPSQANINDGKFTYIDQETGVSFIANNVFQANDNEGTIVINYKVQKEEVVESVDLTFNGFDKLVAQDIDYQNTNRSKMWEISAPEDQNWKGSYGKEKTFEPTNILGTEGRDFWFVYSQDHSQDIIYQVVKKDHKPVYVGQLELLFMSRGDYYGKVKDFYKVEYKTDINGQWIEANVEQRNIKSVNKGLIAHKLETIDIKAEVVAMRVVFLNEHKPSSVTHISSFMPILRLSEDKRAVNNALELVPLLEQDDLRFEQIKKEQFKFVSPEAVNLKYEVLNFALNESKEDITINVRVSKGKESKEYQITNFNNFKTEKQYQFEQQLSQELQNAIQNVVVIVKPESKEKELSTYSINDFQLENPNSSFTYKINNVTDISENQSTGIKQAKITGTIAQNNISVEFKYNVTWQFETDLEKIAKAIKSKEYENEIKKLINFNLLPSEVNVNQLFSYIDKNDNVNFNFISIKEANDYEGKLKLNYQVVKNDKNIDLVVEFNNLNKLVLQDADYQNTNRSKMWNINADEADSQSYGKNNIFTPVGSWGTIGQNYWYVKSDNSKDITLEITKKDNQPIYVGALELIFMNYSGYFKEKSNFYKIEYKTSIDSEWQQVNTQLKETKNESINAIPHTREKIKIANNVVAIKVVFTKGNQPSSYVHISSLMPMLKEK
ncbi:lipoprotein 17-related variable surface protein [Mesomycoplasma lagogenitalium]|uniref:Lipoprotein 17-related variable surface protein n=1 Tax=Mesomycoplasma lagogenitalium TaxID=171286 RepID=A0ABY8LVV0_9BACT|nr:lipoprotein 17-related variable surface protein [Mesomycoplasma lagogenitalium]WGI36282.1 lipoprotein 17-related variable surface protein [Mesomycoplasma lagogenitalium]